MLASFLRHVGPEHPLALLSTFNFTHTAALLFDESGRIVSFDVNDKSKAGYECALQFALARLIKSRAKRPSGENQVSVESFLAPPHLAREVTWFRKLFSFVSAAFYFIFILTALQAIPLGVIWIGSKAIYVHPRFGPMLRKIDERKQRDAQHQIEYQQERAEANKVLANLPAGLSDHERAKRVDQYFQDQERSNEKQAEDLLKQAEDYSPEKKDH